MLQNWIDKISDRWATIVTHEGGTLRAHKMSELDDFPETVSAPAVITYPSDVSLTYSVGGPILAHWVGRSEFYLFPNVSKSNLPRLLPYFERIAVAAMGSITLSGSVLYFMIDSTDAGSPSMEGPVQLTYGDNDNPYLGIVVNWKVKENISGMTGLSVAA